jgi:hypothetical protein
MVPPDCCRHRPLRPPIEPVTGITFDGTGFPTAGTWAGEVSITGNCKNFRVDHCYFYPMEKKSGLAQTIYCQGPGKVAFTRPLTMGTAHPREGVLRFSLAGVQLKFSAVMEASGGLTISARGNSPGPGLGQPIISLGNCLTLFYFHHSHTTREYRPPIMIDHPARPMA